MEAKRASLRVTRVASAGNAAKVEWTLAEGEGRYLARLPFEASFQWRDESRLEFSDEGVDVPCRTITYAFLAIAIPTLCYENDEVLIRAPFRVTEADRPSVASVWRAPVGAVTRIPRRGAAQAGQTFRSTEWFRLCFRVACERSLLKPGRPGSVRSESPHPSQRFNSRKTGAMIARGGAVTRQLREFSIELSRASRAAVRSLNAARSVVSIWESP